MEEIVFSLAMAASAAGFWKWFLERQAVASTGERRRLTHDEARALVQRINTAEFVGWFSVPDVLAIIEIESAFDPDAVRYEAHLDDSSIGLMQVLTSTAADRGYQGPPSGLFDAEVNVRLGMRHMKWTFDYLARRLGRAPTIDEWIGGYNAGVGNVVRNGWWNAGYVQKWRAARERHD
jgi:hypothetical protein